MANLRMLNQPNPFWEWVAEMDNVRRAREEHSNGNGEGPSDREVPDEDTKTAEEPPSQEKEKQRELKVDEDKTPLGDDFDAPPSPSTFIPYNLPNFQHTPPPPPPPAPPGPYPPPPEFQHPPSPPPPAHHGGWGGRGRHHHHRGGRHGHPGPHGHGPWGTHSPPWTGGRWGGRRGRGGFPGWGKFFGGMNMEGLNMEALGEFMKDNFGFDAGQPKANADDKDFKPPADLFDTAEAFIIHISLAGAKKEDLGVSWDPEHQEIQVAGVIHRPGDEEFLKTIALEERDIGVFERKIKLGTKAQPASVNADGISAKMEDGVLMIRVPKDQEFVEIKHVDIE